MADIKVIKIGEFEIEVGKNVLETLTTFDKLKAEDWKKLATAAKLVCEPFEKRLLKPVLMGVIQNAWYQTVEGKIPEKCKANQATRVTHYATLLEQLKNSDGKDLLVKPPKAKSETAKSTVLWVLTTKGVGAKLTGQQFVMAKAMKTQGFVQGKTGASVADITAKLVEVEGIITPSDKNVAFHLNKWSKDGLAARVDEKGQFLKEEAPSAEKKEDPKPKAEAKKK